jgi:hypothetical protein
VKPGYVNLQRFIASWSAKNDRYYLRHAERVQRYSDNSLLSTFLATRALNLAAETSCTQRTDESQLF